MSVKVNSTTVNDVYLNRNVGYTIVGSPTIVNGVVSGCDYSNYLNLNSLFPDINNSDVDVFITLKSAGIGAGKGFRNVFSNLWGTIIALTNSSTPTFTVYTKKNGESTYTARNIYNYSAQVNSNNNFYLHFTKKGKVLSIQGANNDGVFKTASTYTLEEGEEIGLSSGYPEVMRAGAWENIENSAIDLNHTYIKVNGITWFNGKETASSTVNEVYYNKNCGYTVEGSPTISNGVVSGFSSNDYVYNPNFKDNGEDIEWQIAFSTSSIGNKAITGTSYGWQYDSQFVIAKGKLRFSVKNGTVLDSSYTLSTDTFYKAKLSRTNGTYTLQLYYNNQLVDSVSLEDSTLLFNGVQRDIYLGYDAANYAGSFYNGSIDLNHTYIKINGITFFNGKETASPAVNTLQINGTTVWTRGA